MATDDSPKLLARYIETGSDEAFRSLVDLHVDLVYSAAMRQVREHHLAEEVTQIVFITLARKAAGLRRETVLGAWLLVTTRNVALNALKGMARRKKHESKAAQMANVARQSSEEPQRGDTSPDWDAVAGELDGAMACLSASDRQAIVLRYFEDRSVREVADALGIELEAAKQRVHRATGRLRTNLARRGVNVASASVGSLIIANAVTAAPVGVAVSVAHGAIAAGATGAISASTPFSKGIAILMALTKTKVVAFAAVAVLLCGGAAVIYQMVRPVREQVVPLAAVSAADNARSQSIGSGDRSVNQSSDVLTEGWEARFNAAYGLAPGEVLKLIPPPILPERQFKWDAERGRMGEASSEKLTSIERLVFAFDGKSIHWQMRTIAGDTLLNALVAINVEPYQLDASIPVNLAIVGDWTVRKGATVDQKMAALGGIVSKIKGNQVRFEKRIVSREAIIVRGTFAFTPLPGHANGPEGKVLHYGPPLPPGGSRAMPNEAVAMSEVYSQLQRMTRAQVIDESGSGSQGVVVSYNSFSLNDSPKVMELLTRQTGLRFAREPRETPVWFMVEDK